MGKLRDELDRMWGGPFPRPLDYVAGNRRYGTECVFYLADDLSGDAPQEQVGRLVRAALTIPVQKGAIHGTGCKLVAPGGDAFWGWAYWGDPNGWSARVALGAKTLKLVTGELRNDILVTSDGRSFHLDNCEVWFDLSQKPDEIRLVRWPDDDKS